MSQETAGTYDPTLDVRYALRIAHTYLGFYDRLGLPIRGSRVLELGPGKDFGSVMVLRCLGAECAVADLYLSEFDPKTHPTFYAALADAVGKLFPDADLAPLRKLVADKRYSDEIIGRFARTCEDLSNIPTGTYDLIVSNAVMEHVPDPAIAFRELCRITKPGGFGVHQIDYRDHRNFDRPLEYIFMPEKEFRGLFKSVQGTCGNRFRARHFWKFFEDSGFTIDAIEHNMLAKDSYLKDVFGRAKQAGLPYSEEDLKVLSGRIYVAKPPEGARAFESSMVRSGRVPEMAMLKVREDALPLPQFHRRLYHKVADLLRI